MFNHALTIAFASLCTDIVSAIEEVNIPGSFYEENSSILDSVYSTDLELEGGVANGCSAYCTAGSCVKYCTEYYTPYAEQKCRFYEWRCYDYYYPTPVDPSYDYNSGQTIVAIIILEVLLPLLCCVGIVVTICCISKSIKKRRLRETEIERKQLMDHQENQRQVAYMEQPG